MSPGPRPTSPPSCPLATIDMGRKWGLCPPFFAGGGAGSPSNTRTPWPRPTSYQVASSSIQPFGHNRNRPKIGGCAPFLEGEELAGSPSNTSRLGRGLPPYQVAFKSIQIFGHNGHGPKIGGLCPFGGSEFPSNTMWPGPRPTCLPSFILIHSTVWPQYTKVTDRTDRQDNGPIA